MRYERIKRLNLMAAKEAACWNDALSTVDYAKAGSNGKIEQGMSGQLGDLPTDPDSYGDSKGGE